MNVDESLPSYIVDIDERHRSRYKNRSVLVMVLLYSYNIIYYPRIRVKRREHTQMGTAAREIKCNILLCRLELTI